MKKLLLRLLPLFMFAAALTLWAADVWVAKPYTDWTEKDIQKIMTDSPWAKKVDVTFDSAGLPGGGPRGRTSGPQGESTDPGIEGGAVPGIAESGSSGGRGGRGGGGGGGGGGAAPSGGGVPESELTIRWQSAPTIVQALVKNHYGAEAATNPEAQKQLQPEEMFYVIWVAGLPGGVRPRDNDAKKTLLLATTLSAKDKDSLVASDVVFPDPQAGRGGRTVDAHFLFPRKVAFSADDKEIEFATKFGKTSVKTKFTLKNMVINGKLGL